jgi:hypothetical protein
MSDSDLSESGPRAGTRFGRAAETPINMDMRCWRGLRSLAAAALATSILAIAPASSARAAVPTANPTRTGVSLYGSVLTWSPAKLRQQLDLVRNMGATWVRVPMDWATLQMHGRGTYNWAPADFVVAEARKRHLRIMPVVSYTPSWARRPGRPGTDPPTNTTYYGQFLAQMAQRYSPKGIHYWEIWNEPNIQSMWTPRPNASQYVKLLKSAYYGLHTYDKHAVVITGGLSPALDARDRTQVSPYTFLSAMYRDGAHGFFNAVGLHPSTYPYPSTYSASWSTFSKGAPQLYNLMAHRHDANKHVWATEIGFPTGTDRVAVSEGEQGPYLVEGVRAWQRRAYSGPIFVYSMTDEGPNRADHYENFGLVRYNGTPKPAYAALRASLRGS